MNSIKIKLIIECILFVGSIAIAILTHNSEKVPKKNRQWIVGVSFIIAFATFSGSFLINQIPEPIIDRAADYSKIILSTDEKMTIEYRISTNGDSSNDWIKYDGPFKLEKNAVIYARAKTLFYKSNPVYRDVYVSEGKLVYFGLADKPGDTIIDITASYNYKEAVKNKSASNHYDGYTIKKEDIHITGRDMNDNEKEIKDFTYSPKMIKDGENIITIEYPITSDYTLQTKLKVIGNEPTLIRLNAEFIGRTLFIDTPLDNNDFVVYGVYEDGTSQVVDGYMISSATIKEGDNRITITKDGLSTMLEITGVDRETITENESEPNNEIKTANEIDANVKYSGTIRDTDDVDYYKLRLKEKGSIKILFAHPKIDEDGDFWSVSLLSKEETVRVGINVKGKDVETTSSRARVTPGDYYVKVSKQRFSNEKYTYSYYDYIDITLGDPISSIFLNDNYIIIGTMTGRIKLFSLNSKNNEIFIISSTNLEHISGLSFNENENLLFASVGDEQILKYEIRKPLSNNLSPGSSINIYESSYAHNFNCDNSYVLMSTDSLLKINIFLPETEQTIKDIYIHYEYKRYLYTL